MRPAADGTGPALEGSHIGSPRDVLRCLQQITPGLMPSESLVLFLDREHQLLTHLHMAYDPFSPIGPSIPVVFREAFAKQASRLVIVARHPSCRTGPFVPAGDHIEHAAKCSLTGQLLDLRLIDYLLCNDTDSQSLLIDFRDELYRHALHYSQQLANPLPTDLCPN
ncbi:MAG TPA: JAB domain-containing protein [Nitrospira sp.]|nr:JAB domain-containing protein [Nitrospira sp.]